MKKLILVIIALSTSIWVSAQNYRTEFENTSSNKIDIMACSHDVTIIGHDKNEIIIETNYKGDGKPQPQPPKPTKEPSERAKGLQPLTSSGSDNTGIGLSVDKSGSRFSVVGILNEATEAKYTFRIPNKAKLTINEMKPSSKSAYQITGMIGEMNLNALNSNFNIKDATGPVVASNINGGIEITFTRLNGDKPSSLTSVNGFVDITLPVNSKADVQISAVNGEAFTDFDIKPTNTHSEGMPVIPNFSVFNLEGKINGGGTPLTISTVNGDVFIRKGK